jgi:signal peptidase I
MGDYPRIAREGGGRSPVLAALPGSWAVAPRGRPIDLHLPQLSPTTRSALRTTARAAGVVRWILLVAATLIMGGVTVASLLGFRVMIVTSGSMVPTFGPGDAVVVRPGGAGGVRPGNVITFRAPGVHGMTTHRVLSVRVIKGTRWFQTKGDANSTSDPNLVPGDAVYGREVLTLPGLGRFLYMALTPKGKLALLGLPLCFLVAQEAGVLLRARRRRPEQIVPEPQEDSPERASQPALAHQADAPALDPVIVILPASEPIAVDPYVRVEAELRTESARLDAAEAALAELERKLTELQADNRHVRLSDDVSAPDLGLHLHAALAG